MARRALVLGGARSGKSAFAEALADRLAAAQALRKIYLATARREWEGREDPEFLRRIETHRQRRGDDWDTVEAPEDLAEALMERDGEGRIFLVDCLSLWLTNRLLATDAQEGDGLTPAIDALAAAIREMRAPVIVVSNEVGLGLVPETALGRRFRDAQGAANQRIAREAELVAFLAAGLPLTLKGDLKDWR